MEERKNTLGMTTAFSFCAHCALPIFHASCFVRRRSFLSSGRLSFMQNKGTSPKLQDLFFLPFCLFGGPVHLHQENPIINHLQTSEKPAFNCSLNSPMVVVGITVKTPSLPLMNSTVT